MLVLVLTHCGAQVRHEILKNAIVDESPKSSWARPFEKQIVLHIRFPQEGPVNLEIAIHLRSLINHQANTSSFRETTFV